MVKPKSKKKITKIKMKSCPCPDHKGKKLPATSEYWHRGGNPDGFQGYCKQWRNKSQNAANKAARKTAKRAGKKAAQKKVKRNQQKVRSRNRPKLIKAAIKTINKKPIERLGLNDTLFCKQCEVLGLSTLDFQSNGKGGFRQPCKSCIAKKRAELKKKVDIPINS